MNGWRQGFEALPIASWDIAVVRTFLLDPVNGLDTNLGFSDGAGPYNPATQAKRTIGALRTVFPVSFAGRRFRLIMAAGAYATGLEQIINGASGIGVASLIRGTATSVTAGTVAFSDDAADRIHQGWTTATGMNPAGYRPTGVLSASLVQCLTAGGAAPAFGAEPALPGGVRIRFDSTTTTAALRNICRSIVQVTGSDTLAFDSALPAVPVAADTFYIEMGGLNFPTQSLFVQASGVTATLQLCGFFSAGSLTLGSGDWRLVGAKVNSVTVQNFSASQQSTTFTEPTTGAVVSIGGCVRSETTANYARGLFKSVSAGGCYSVGTFSVAGVSSLSASNVVAHDVSLASLAPGAAVIGGRTFAAAGSAGLLFSSAISIQALVCTGAGAKPAIAFNSFGPEGYTVTFMTTGGVSGSAGNLDVGMDVTGAVGCTFVLGLAPSVTGALGDVRTASGIITWAQAAAGFTDANGNQFLTAGVGAVDFLKLASVARGQALVSFFQSPEIDFLTLGATAIVAKAMPGFYPMLATALGRIIFTQRTGAVVVGPVFKLGSNAAHDDVGTGYTTTAPANLNAAAAPFQTAFSSPIATQQIAEATADLIVEVTTAATGATVLKGKIIVGVLMVPV